MSTCQNDIFSNPAGSSVATSRQAAAGTERPNSIQPAESTAQRPQQQSERLESAPSVLVADGDPDARKTIQAVLQSVGYKVIEAANGHEGLRKMSERIDVAILDLFLRDASGRECLRYIRKHFPDTQVIVTSQTGNIHEVVTAMKEGALEYINKPCDRDELVIRVRQAVGAAKLARDNRKLRQAVSFPVVGGNLVGNSPEMQAVREQIESFAQVDSTVLITGAGGTGKTIAAQLIHCKGPRYARPFVSVNCRALPRDLVEVELFGHVRGAFPGATSDRPGRAEIANGGTLLLDEVGNLPPELQPKLLNLLRDQTVQRIGSEQVMRVDVRVIATTSRDLAALCRQGRFREDLLFRLNVLSLRMPALKEHRIDLVELASEILLRIARRRGTTSQILAESAAKAIEEYDWPGNVAEMENVLERASASCDGHTIRRKDLLLNQLWASGPSAESAGGIDLAGMPLAEIERIAIIETLQACGGNKVKTARQLGVSEKTIYNKLKQYNMTGKI